MGLLVDGVEELQKMLAVGRQQWLLGAGVSFGSNIPLMYPLTEQVKSLLTGDDKVLVLALMSDLEDGCHIEHALSHLGDLIAIAARSRTKMAKVGATDFSVTGLKKAYESVISAIVKTIRYGYCAAQGSEVERVGTPDSPIVEVEPHRKFIHQLFKGRANLEGRSHISFATTNYDTLLEDALALERRAAADGFAGGAISYWNGDDIDSKVQLPGKTHRVLKLHGSVDWFSDKESGLLRVRYGVKYLSELSRTLIYPQATKYAETQKDPFAKIFDSFRKSLMEPESHVLAIVGYSFGDNHINDEIEHALRERGNRTNIIAFSQEQADTSNPEITVPCATLQNWRNDADFGSRIYVVTDNGLYIGGEHFPARTGTPLKWWTFAGLTNFLEHGVAA